MTATYDSSLATDTDKIRLMLNDRDVTAAKFSDEEIAATRLLHKNNQQAAAALAETLAAEYAGKPDISIDGASWNYKGLAEQYRALARALRKQVSELPGGIGAPVVTGISIADMKANDANTDRPADPFGAGRFDYDETTNYPQDEPQ